MMNNIKSSTTDGTKGSKKDRKLGKKLNKCRHLLLKHENLKPSYHPTKHIFVANGGLLNQIQHHEMTELFGQYAGLTQVSMVAGKPYCFASFKEEGLAVEAFTNLQAFELHDKPGPEKVVIYLLYVNQVPEHVKNSPDAGSLPSGLHLIPDFVDDVMEKKLLTSLNWDTSSLEADQLLKQRQVQHYGYRFCYDTNDVDRANPLPGGLGPLYQGIADKILESNLVKHPLDQLTINYYQPGHGIPSHVDTHSAFEDGFCSLSLGSQVVMLFTHPTGAQVPVVLPPKSLLVLTGEARYLWSHGIVARKSDVIPTKDDSSADALTVVPRGTRTSFTFRSVKWTPCKCEFPGRCDSQGYMKNSEMKNSSDKNGKTPVKLPSNETEAASLEASHVHTVYDNIAPHFSETRYKPWPPVVEFLNSIPSYSLVLDVGCGNGKYLGVNSEIFKVGCDRSRNLIGICRDKSHQAFVCDSLSLPVRSHSLDACICIAVLHHFATLERRRQGIVEIVRVLRPGGKALVTVWALEQEKNKKKSTYLKKPKATESIDDVDDAESVTKECSQDENAKASCLKDLSSSSTDSGEPDPVTSDLNIHSNRTQFKQQDMLVPWHFKKPGEKVTSEKDFEVYHRFYHVFVEGELEQLCKQVPGVLVEKCYYVEGNWFIIIQKDTECIKGS